MNNWTTGQKFDQEKPRMDLIDPWAIEGLAKVLTFGAQKYEANNWRKGIEYTRLIAAMQRHLNAIQKGEDIDPESNLPHIDHLGCCWMFLSNFMKTQQNLDNRWKKKAIPNFTWRDREQLPVEYQNYPVNGAGYSGNYHEADAAAQNNKAAFERGDIVRKRSGSAWEGRVCGEYSTSLTPKGYAVESDKHPGSVQIYPEAALELIGLKQQAALASWPVPPPRTIGGSAYKPPQILNNKKVADILNKEFNTQMKDCPND